MSDSYYQKHKERLEKKTYKRYQDLSKEEKNKKHNMLMNNIEIFLKKRKAKASVWSRMI